MTPPVTSMLACHNRSWPRRGPTSTVGTLPGKVMASPIRESGIGPVAPCAGRTSTTQVPSSSAVAKGR